jgi:hypothetical protein
MFQLIIIGFFIFFLTSRFFSEVVRILPKWVDILNFPFITLIGLIALFYQSNKNIDLKEHKFFVKLFFSFCFVVLLSTFINFENIFIPAAILFTIAFIEGPLLFISLNKIVGNIELFVNRVRYYFYFLLVVNIAVVLFIDTPIFLSTGNPDVIAGTYGLNSYYFSVLLIICGGMLFGEYVWRGKGKITQLIIGQVFILVTFFLLQFRAALPFFLLSYGIMLIILYGRRILVTVMSFSFVAMIIGSIVFNFFPKDTAEKLKYEDWLQILSDPIHFLQYGKFLAYPQTIKMMEAYPHSILVGIGPGTYISRAYYTFSYEMIGFGKSEKGVSSLANKMFGVESAKFSSISQEFLAPTQTGAILGTYQLSNPNSSYLAPIAEVGLIGGGIMILMYLYLLRKSFKLLRLAKEYVQEYLPLASALVASSVYLFCLAFLDNYWEMSRVTLPVWLLFWGTNVGINIKLQKYEKKM